MFSLSASKNKSFYYINIPAIFIKLSIFIALFLPACVATAQPQADVASKGLEPNIPNIVRGIRADNIERTIRTLVSFGTRNTLSVQDDPAHGIGAAREWIYNEFLKLRVVSAGRLRVEKQRFIQPVVPRIPVPTPLTNIVAILPGDLPEDHQRYIIVSGHYDSICTDPVNAVDDAPGANDDASGVAAVLETARVMVSYQFHATIIFLAVAGEEQGLLGSTYYAEQAKQNNWRIEGMLTNDIVGGTLGGNGKHDDHSVRVFSEGVPSDETPLQANLRRGVGGENDSASRQLARFIKEMGEKYVRGMKVTLVYRRDRYLRGGDHIPFNERGFPAVRFTEPNENYAHQHQNVRTEDGMVYGDLPEFVDFSYVAQVARVNAAALATLALAPAPPRQVGLVTRRLTNDTDLRWEASAEPDLAGYEVVWRETTGSLWTHRRAMGKETSCRLKGLSKDDYCFGVRALDTRGYRSVVVVPSPIR